MGKKAAITVTAALTIFILGAGALLALRLSDPLRVQAAEMDAATSMLESQVEVLLTRERQYQSALLTANQRIEEANSVILALERERASLADKNILLVEREEAYKLAIEEANARLEELAATPQIVTIAAPPPSSSGDTVDTSYEDDHDEDHEDHEDHESEHDDD